MPAAFASAIQNLADAMFMPWTVIVLFGAGAFLTVRYRVVQIRRFAEGLRTLVPAAEPGSSGVLTPFQAFMTALAASIGTGNIAGVATALVTGGPGALFWIWCYGILATAVKFTEAVLGVTFRETRPDGSVSAGPMQYLRIGMKSPALAYIYALVAGVACLTTTPFTQPNSMAVVLYSQFQIPTWVSGVIIAALAWLVIIGGVKSIGRAAEKLAPLKVGLYLAGGLIVIVTHASRLPAVLSMVVREAFSMPGAIGGAAGVGFLVSLRYGLARGVYANEAGYGTAGVMYGAAQSTRPLQQGLNAMMEVFIISFVTSTISALTVLVSGAWDMQRLAPAAERLTSTALVAQAFNTAIPTFGGWIVAFCAFLFGYTTLIGWAYYGEQFLEYLFGPRITLPYRWIYCLLVPFGAMAKVDLVWAWGDFMNGLQIFPNIIGVIGLSGVVAKIANDRSAGQAASRAAR